MTTLLDAISEGWAWKIGLPVAVVATNSFGNAIVLNADGHYFRIMPEEWSCELLATSAAALDAERKKDEFVRDWTMAPLVARAEIALGPLAEGQSYFLVKPGVLGGKYSEENIRKITLRELLAYCGSMARQIADVPDGESVTIVPKEVPNQSPEPTSGIVTSRAEPRAAPIPPVAHL
jgi:hypothetical protein